MSKLVVLETQQDVDNINDYIAITGAEPRPMVYHKTPEIAIGKVVDVFLNSMFVGDVDDVLEFSADEYITSDQLLETIK